VSGDSLTFGIDYGVRKIAVAGIRRGNIVSLSDLVLSPGGLAHESLPLLVDFVDRALMENHKPSMVAVEAPIMGSSGAAQTVIKMSMVAGAIISYLHARNIPLIVVPPSTWKSVSIGNGNASKASIHDWAELRWPGWAKTEDESDALGLSVYADLHLHGIGAVGQVTP
jgi:Holliday junction resolvasome RuvABC endonuclease subunit